MQPKEKLFREIIKLEKKIGRQSKIEKLKLEKPMVGDGTKQKAYEHLIARWRVSAKLVSKMIKYDLLQSGRLKTVIKQIS